MIDYHEVTGAPRIVLGTGETLMGLMSSPGLVRLYFDTGVPPELPPGVVQYTIPVQTSAPETAAAVIEFLDPDSITVLVDTLLTLARRAFPGYEPRALGVGPPPN